MDTDLYRLIQTHRMNNSKRDPNIYCGWQLIIIYQYQLIIINITNTTLTQDDNNRRDGVHLHGNFLSFLFNFPED